jgi:hypothetical protein
MTGIWLLAGGLAFAAGGPSVASEDKPTMAAEAKVSHAEGKGPARASKSVKAAKKGSKASIAAKSGRKNKPSSVKAAPGPGRMQVDEPKTAAPMGTARESKAWQKKNAARGLTDNQKQAFRERKEKMEGMISVIKEKRMAMKDAKPEDRAALARELHSLILEKDGGASVTAAARVGKEGALDAKVREAEIEKKKAAEIQLKQDEARQQALERKEELRKQQEEMRKQQMEKLKEVTDKIIPPQGLYQEEDED